MRYFGPLNAYISNLSYDHNVSHYLKAVTGILISTGTLAQQLWEVSMELSSRVLGVVRVASAEDYPGAPKWSASCYS